MLRLRWIFIPLVRPFSLSLCHSLTRRGIAVLMDKGIIVGIDQETSLRRSLNFAIFRIITSVRPPSPVSDDADTS